MPEPDPIHPPVPAIPAEVLAAYALGELPQDQAREVAAAVDASEVIRRKVDQLRATVRALHGGDLVDPPREVVRKVIGLVGSSTAPAGAGWMHRVADVVARLVFDSRAGGALAGFRSSGSAETRHLTFETENAEIDLEVARTGAGRYRVQGQVARDSTEAEVRVGFLNAEGILTAPVDPKGMFARELAGGTWEVRIAMGERVVSLPPIRLE